MEAQERRVSRLQDRCDAKGVVCAARTNLASVRLGFLDDFLEVLWGAVGTGDAQLVLNAKLLEHLHGLLGDGQVGARAQDDGNVQLGARSVDRASVLVGLPESQRMRHDSIGRTCFRSSKLKTLRTCRAGATSRLRDWSEVDSGEAAGLKGSGGHCDQRRLCDWGSRQIAPTAALSCVDAGTLPRTTEERGDGGD